MVSIDVNVLSIEMVDYPCHAVILKALDVENLQCCATLAGGNLNITNMLDVCRVHIRLALRVQVNCCFSTFMADDHVFVMPGAADA